MGDRACTAPGSGRRQGLPEGGERLRGGATALATGSSSPMQRHCAGGARSARRQNGTSSSSSGSSERVGASSSRSSRLSHDDDSPSPKPLSLNELLPEARWDGSGTVEG